MIAMFIVYSFTSKEAKRMISDYKDADVFVSGTNLCRVNNLLTLPVYKFSVLDLLQKFIFTSLTFAKVFDL